MPTPGPRATCRYRDVFKPAAVRLSRFPGALLRDVADVARPKAGGQWRYPATVMDR